MPKYDEISCLVQLYFKKKNNIKVGHININLYYLARHKFDATGTALGSYLIVVPSLPERKLMKLFHIHSLFCVENYKIYRKDQRCKGGGLVMPVEEDSPQRRKVIWSR